MEHWAELWGGGEGDFVSILQVGNGVKFANVVCSENEHLEEKAGRHTYLSFAWSEKKGAYVTMYYSPDVERQGK